MITIGILHTKERGTDRLNGSPANEWQSQDLNEGSLLAGPNYSEMPTKTSSEEMWYIETLRVGQRQHPLNFSIIMED